ncbi:hypothetical protein WDU94_002317 [Cyamophila willieti]
MSCMDCTRKGDCSSRYHTCDARFSWLVHCCGLLLFLNGGWILLFESGSVLRAVFMCANAYFKIWRKAKQDWIAYLERQKDVQRMKRFPEASMEMLKERGDVCAICTSEMTSARVTGCGHCFHRVCLRKWIYVKELCPICRTDLRL